MADVTYNTDMFPALLRTLDALVRVRMGVSSQPPLILLAYKERDPGERTLFALASDLDLRFELVDQLPGAGGHPIEIYLGTMGVRGDASSDLRS